MGEFVLYLVTVLWIVGGALFFGLAVWCFRDKWIDLQHLRPGPHKAIRTLLVKRELRGFGAAIGIAVLGLILTFVALVPTIDIFIKATVGRACLVGIVWTMVYALWSVSYDQRRARRMARNQQQSEADIGE